MNKISIVIITCSRSNDLKRLLESLKKTIKNFSSIEIIIIDSGNSKSFEINSKIISSFFTDATHVSSEKEISWQRNTGISLSKGEFILFLDDDVILEEDYLTSIMECFTEPDVIGATGYVANQKNYSFLERLFRKIFLLQDVNNRKTYRKISGYFSFLNKPKQIVNTEALWGCNMIIKKKFLEKCSFDENLNFYDDIELSLRLLKLGKLCLSEDARLIHKRSNSDRDKPWKIMRKQVISNLYISKKHQRINTYVYCAFLWSSIGMFILMFLCYIFQTDLTKGTLEEYGTH